MNLMSEAMQPGVIVSQVEFARLAQVNPSQVTRWIQTGKIHGEALVKGKRGKGIVVTLAVQQLQITLDSSQQAAKSLPIWSVASSPGASLPASAQAEPAGNAVAMDLQEQRRRKMTAEATRAEADLLRDMGELVRVKQYNAELRQALEPLLLTFDELPMDLVDRLCKTIGDTSRAQEMLIVVRQSVLALRARWVDMLSRADLSPSAPAGDQDVAA